MSTHTRVKAARWTTAIAAAAVLALTGTGAEAAAPVSGTEAVITVGARGALPVVSPDGTKAYVVATEADNTLKVKVVDTQSGAITGQLTLGTTAFSVYPALSADGSRLYVVNGPQLTVVNTAALTAVATVALPDQPRQAGWYPGTPSGVAVSPDGAKVYVVQNGPTAYRQYGPGRVLAFATAQQAFTASVQVPGSFTGTAAVRPNGQDVYVGSSSGVSHLNTAGAAPTLVGTIAGTDLDYRPVLTPDGTRLIAVADGSKGGQADLIDPATDTVTKHVALTSGYTSLTNPQISVDGTRLYVTNDNYDSGSSVFSFDSTTGAAYPAETVSPDEDQLNGLAVGPDGHTLYIGGTIGSSAANLQIVSN
ncbi:hypothetical protein [Kitasatospora aureofaciens]|uniref:hypothetical protein n=1 Tax=Kitasatospora aureofaciens TaxID=1894 RepID=UPI001C47B851|nr:hypothetical protein [Kitasatospora aureofaciens]MBV6695755.1 hypothetical protein [Kitasatospora aureofaciens]